jgi:hypothetical protein
VLRSAEDLLGRAALDDPPCVHHRDLVGRLGHHAGVVRDDDDRDSEAPLDVIEQRQDLGLHRNVERGRRFVGDQQLRLVAECRRNHRPLPHPALELMRLLVDALAPFSAVRERYLSPVRPWRLDSE